MPKDANPEKRASRRIPSDDCVVEGRHPHRGEWVEISGATSVHDLRAQWNATSLAVQIESLRDDEEMVRREIVELRATTGGDAATRKEREAQLHRAEKDLQDAVEARINLIDGSFDELAKAVARRVVAWNWTNDLGLPIVPWNATDEDGSPYTILDGSSATIELVEPDEMTYLRGLLTGEAPAERKNGDGGSPTTSSDTGSPPTARTPSNASAPSRTKR